MSRLIRNPMNCTETVVSAYTIMRVRACMATTPLRDAATPIGCTFVPWKSRQFAETTALFGAGAAGSRRFGRRARDSRRLGRFGAPHRVGVLGVDECRSDAGDEERKDARHHHREREFRSFVSVRLRQTLELTTMGEVWHDSLLAWVVCWKRAEARPRSRKIRPKCSRNIVWHPARFGLFSRRALAE